MLMNTAVRVRLSSILPAKPNSSSQRQSGQQPLRSPTSLAALHKPKRRDRPTTMVDSVISNAQIQDVLGPEYEQFLILQMGNILNGAITGQLQIRGSCFNRHRGPKTRRGCV
eukprot:6173453-Pleurochrysis_carterae.AAC.1